MKQFFRSKIMLAGALVLFSAAITPSSMGLLRDQSRYEVNAADLADISILEGTKLSSKKGTVVNDGVKLEKNADSTYDLNLSFKGTGVADIGLASSKVVVFAIPEELRGKLEEPILINADAKLLPIVPGDIPGVKDLVVNVGGLITKLLGLAKPLGLELDSLTHAFEAINSLQDLGSYHAALEGKLSADGKYVMVDFTDGLGEYVRSAYAGLFDPLEEAVDELKFSGLLGPILNPVLNLLKPIVGTLLNVVEAIANGTSNVLTEALQANLLGDVTFELSTKVSNMTAEKATISASAVNTPLIDVDVLNTVAANGDTINLYFEQPAEDPLTNYPISKPIVEDITEGMSSLKGNIDLTEPLPAGVSITAKVELPDGTIISGNIDDVGYFTIPFGDYQPQIGDELKVTVEATDGTHTKASEAETKQVSADPFIHYLVAKPTVEDILEGMTGLSGSVDVTEPLPAGVTLTAKVELPDGTTLSGNIAPDGQFLIPFGDYQPQGNDQLKVRIEASDGNRVKASEPEVKQVVVDPLRNYQVQKPQFKNVNEGSQFITGSVPSEAIPAGTHLFVQVQFPDGSVRKVAVENDGTFSISLADKTLKEGNPLRLVTVAEHTQSFNGKSSESVVFAVGKIPSLSGYTVPAPIVSPIFVGNTTINGKINIGNAPEGTQFKVRVKFPGNIYEETELDENGAFSLNLAGRQLTAGTSITFNTVATLGVETASSTRIIVSVGAE